MGSWGNAPSRSARQSEILCRKGFLRRSLKLGLGQRPIAALPQKCSKSQIFLSVTQHTNIRCPPKVAKQSAPAFGGHINLDKAMPHLRAAAGIYADVQADGIVHQREEESKRR